MTQVKIKKMSKGDPPKRIAESDVIWFKIEWSEQTQRYEVDVKGNPADPAIPLGFMRVFRDFVFNKFEIPPIVQKEFFEICNKWYINMSNFLGGVKHRGGRILE